MKALQKSSINQWLLAAFLSMLCPLTMAAGFEGEVTSMIIMVRNGIYAVVGAVATIALLWQFAQGFMGRKTWGDILETALWIVGAGAGIVIATWLFTKGGSMSI
ncbi:TrbC/VirB2 family protein [Neisseria sp. Ec49-e6-T10]|uniref:TrbC/VirB2 family protein n=1 Tax=Neisseria sp. Ec49-e6-T10 TaxID=3140744 RepID=UPI003EB7C2A4